MVVDALIYHPTVTHYNTFVSTTIGRDKALRTIQYLARFLAATLSEPTAPLPPSTSSVSIPYKSSPSLAKHLIPAALYGARRANLVSSLTTLKSNLALVRKALRIGKFVEHVRAARVAVDAPLSSFPALVLLKTFPRSGSWDELVVRYMTVGRQVGYAGYLFADMLTYLDAAGVVAKGEFGKRWQSRAYKLWVLGLVCSVVTGGWALMGSSKSGRTLLGVKEKEIGKEKERDEEGRKKIVRERKQLQIQLLSDLCDLTIPTSGLGWVNFDDRLVGLAGTISSVIGLQAQWDKTAPR